MGRSVNEHAEAVAAAIHRAHERRAADASVPRSVAPGLSGRLARPALSSRDIPGFDNSQMDGFAVHSADLVTAGADPVALPTVAHIVAGGGTPPPLRPGTVAPIMTGAPIPDGADAVVPVERTRPGGFGPVDGGESIEFRQPVPPGTFIRELGSDIRAGEPLLDAGAPLNAAAVGALFAAGVETVDVVAPLRVAIVGTGTELVTGDVPDSNSQALLAHALELGLPATGHVVADDPEALRRELSALAAEHDVVITTGGVSAGTREVVRQVLSGTPGAWFDHVDVQPGGPQGLACVHSEGREVPVVCLPGNPVSVMVSFELFLRRPLARAAGRIPSRPAGTAALAEPLESPAGRLQVRRGRFDDAGRIRLVGEAGSHLVASYARAELLVFIPEQVTALSPGDSVEWWTIA
ncbi:gephyrin-like molybdotransferase Glp [Aeromicrobium sp.]|uniref:molybdopterin molybdotransferase MoeA n=1 Tax=Aeromicrobium sp. TaxID=1871063 RepID=UPI0028A8563B|nr:gephyrin-like molybdotransferase Glp [Aeromicrobium sp.]